MMKRITIAFLGALAAFPQAQTPLTVFPSGGSAVGELRLRERRINGQDYTSLKAPHSLAVDVEYTLPSAYPTASGQCLTSTTAGVWSWATCGAVEYDVRTYGAVCDGVTDDTAAFDAAIAAVGSNRGVIVVPNGVCIVTTVDFTSSIQGVRGQGIYASVVKSATDAPVFNIPTVSGSAEFYYMEFRDLTIEGDGSSTSQVGISATGTGRLNVSAVSNVRFQTIRKGLYVSTSINSDYMKFIGNVCQTTYYCVEKAVGGSGWIINSNQISSLAGGTGIYIHGSDAVGDIVINDNHIEEGAVGIALYCDTTCSYGERNVVNGNKIDGTTTAPITAFNVQNSTFLGNRVQGGGAEVVTFTGNAVGNVYDANQNKGLQFSISSTSWLALNGSSFMIDGRGTGSQLHLASTTTGGMYAFSSNDHQAWVMGGIEWDGTQFIPRATQASILRLSQGRMAFFGETGLTPNVAYTPALRWELDSSYNWVPGADNSYSIGSTNVRPQVVYGRQGDFGGGAAGSYDAVNAKNTTTGAYAACYVMSATDSVGATVYGAGRLCGRYTSNNFSSEEIAIQTATGSGTYADAITIVNDDVTIADTLNVTGNFSAAIVNATGNPAYRVGGTTIVDSSRNGSFVNLSASGTLGVTGVATFTGSIATGADNTINIGSSGNKPIRVFTYGLSTYGSSYVVSGSDFNVQSGGTFTAASGSTFNLSTTIAGNVSPSTDGGGDLGTSSLKWGNAHINTADIYSTIRPDTTNVRALGASTRVWSKTWTNDIQINGTVTAPNGNAGQSATVTVRDAAGTGTCTLIFSGGLKTGGTC